ncbi:hypothetical protein FRB96_001977 [Tulasnella sp. 330]|nr:hypothetical protein FRB96_001977 [Tulasnella sp. 330]KAG8878981.1 hypothetical protein FRB97_002029 [Tulasnella sp. 331]
MSHLYPHHLTSCFCDVILIPLATWIFLVSFLIALAAGRSRYKADNADPATRDRPSTQPGRIYTAFYSFFVFAALAMTALEIARLIAAHLGIGLLPFTAVGIVFATALHFSNGAHGRVFAWPVLNVFYWLLLVIFLAVKISEELKEGDHARDGSAYKESDEIIDVATMIGVYCVLFILDAMRISRMRRVSALY